MSNLVDVTSPEHFKELLSADLNRVSCLNFWAPWAEPCAAFTEVVKSEAGKFSSVLFLNVSLALPTRMSFMDVGTQGNGGDVIDKRARPEVQSRVASCLVRASGRLADRSIPDHVLIRTVLTAQIEAESMADISESFDIEAVPSFLLLRVCPTPSPLSFLSYESVRARVCLLRFTSYL